MREQLTILLRERIPLKAKRVLRARFILFGSSSKYRVTLLGKNMPTN